MVAPRQENVCFVARWAAMSDGWQPTPEEPTGQPGSGVPTPGGGPQPPYPPSAPPPHPPSAYPPPHLSGWVPPPPAPKPGVIPLRPLGVAELLDGAITALRRYPKAILLPSFVVALGVGAFGYLLNLASIGYVSDLSTLEPDTATGSDVFGAIGPAIALSLVGVLVQFIATVLLTGVITVVMSQAVLGRPITASDAWVRVKPQVWRLLGLSLLITLAAVGVTAAVTIVVVILGILTMGIGLLLLLAVWVPATVLLTYWAIAPAALLLEKSTITTSFGRAWSLTSGAFWRTFGTLLLMVIVYGVISVAISLPFSVPEIIAPSVDPLSGDVNQTRFVVNTAIATVGDIIVSTVALPFIAGVISLLYIDRRMRKEGLDITLARVLQQP
ncbi:MAG: hypothetical protein ACJ74E_06565 [Actinomycetes bacterium]